MDNLPTYHLNIQAPQSAEKGQFPDTQGIYIAFAYRRSKLSSPSFISLSEAIYIGMSENTADNEGIKGRIADHLRDDHATWFKDLPEGSEIRYGYIELTDELDIETVEAAMINVNKPKFNTEYKDQTPFQLDSVLSFSGAIGTLQPEIRPEDLTLNTQK